MDEITVNRWKRHGHDRAYASLSDGTKLGWMDLTTGKVVASVGVDADQLGQAIGLWANANRVIIAPELPVPDSTPNEAAEEAEPQWFDLAEHRPGELVRAEALAAWEEDKAARPFLSRAARVLNVHTEERAWRMGAYGEEVIGARLDRLLGHGWQVLHSIPVGQRGADIDHVVIGPGGVFTVNSKCHPDARVTAGTHTIWVNGTSYPYYRAARDEASRVRKVVSRALGYDVDVVPCVVIETGTWLPNIDYKGARSDVRVLHRSLVPGWFKRRERVLQAEEVEAIFEVARRSTTWTGR